MSETNITPRQGFVLNLINQFDGVLRENIQTEVEKFYSISKPTLIRDLNTLLSQKLIIIKGRAKNTKYFPFFQNPLLLAFDLERYFQDEPDKRMSS